MLSVNSGGPRRVLVVDDNSVVLAVVRARLQRAGYRVTTRDDAFGTVNAIIDDTPDVILLDVNMPGLSGDTLAKTLLNNPKTAHVRIILHSGIDAAELNAKARKLGVLGALSKTDDDALFLSRFERLVKRAFHGGIRP